MEDKEKVAFIKRIIDNYDEDDLELLNLFHKVLLDLKSEKPQQYNIFKENNISLKQMENTIKVCNICFLRDDTDTFNYIELKENGLYVETNKPDSYFYVDNYGNKVERL